MTFSSVSFLIAAYNEERFISDCIESCLGQVGADIEVCLVDDGSVDDTWSLVTSAYGRNSRVRLHKFSQNKGKVAAFNAAFALSRGDYIALLGADDVNMPDRVSKSLAIARQHSEPFLIFGGYDMCDAKLSTMRKIRKPEKNHAFRDFIDGNHAPGGTFFMSRQVAELAFPIPEALRFEDWWIVAKAALAGVTIRSIPGPLIRYRIHDRNTTVAATRREQLSAKRRDFERHYAWYAEIGRQIVESSLSANEKQRLRKRIACNILYRDLRTGRRGATIRTWLDILMSLPHAGPRLAWKLPSAACLAMIDRI